MGLGYEDVKKIAPHIIYCSITGKSLKYTFSLCLPQVRNDLAYLRLNIALIYMPHLFAVAFIFLFDKRGLLF